MKVYFLTQMLGGSPLRFDSQECRQICKHYQIEANIAFNTRNGSIHARNEYFDEVLYQNRYVIERAFAWLDAFKSMFKNYIGHISQSIKNYLAVGP